MEIDDLSARRQLLDASGLTQGRILDVGTGGCACMARLLVRRGFDVVGVDRSARAVREARIEGCGRFETRRADAEHLPFADGAFDGVVAYRALHHADDTKQVLAEMFRVCKAGGKVMVAELNAHGRREYEEPGDGGTLLRRVGQLLRRFAAHTRRIQTTDNILFICRKGRPPRDRRLS